jgi:type III restriction enzyme
MGDMGRGRVHLLGKIHDREIPAELLGLLRNAVLPACGRRSPQSAAYSKITRQFIGERPIKALLDPYNHTGSTRHVRINTSRADRWDTGGPPPKNHVNWVVLDSDWEAEFCRVAEQHPKVIAYTKNHNLGLEVPYRYGSENRKYLPDFIVLVDDGQGPDNLVTEIKGHRREDAKEKKATMDTHWVPGVNHLGNYGRWAFSEFAEVYQIESDFEAKVKGEFDKMIQQAAGKS